MLAIHSRLGLDSLFNLFSVRQTSMQHTKPVIFILSQTQGYVVLVAYATDNSTGETTLRMPFNTETF